jgi:Beta propeller domain
MRDLRAMSGWATVPVAVCAVLSVLAGCTAGAGQPGPSAGPPGSVAGPAGSGGPPAGTTSTRAPFALTAYDSCAELTDRLRTAARASVGPYGFGNQVVVPAASQPGARTGAQPGAVADHSTTNAAEAGVDEPDQVKTDGRRIVLLNNGWLRVVDPATRRLTGSLRVPGAAFGGQLLLSGDRALVFSGSDQLRTPRPSGLPYASYVPRGALTLVDLAGPGAPRSLGTLAFDGRLVDARQVGAVVRVVVGSRPDIAFPAAPDLRTDAQRTARNRLLIGRAPLRAWLPRFTLTTAGHSTVGQTPCGAVSLPTQFGGDSMLSVLTLDLGQPLGNGTPVSVAADGDTVYATATNLYVSLDERGYLAPTPGSAAKAGTEIYQLDISGAGPPRFVASGAVPGHLLNGFALSEYADRLRVATTLEGPATSSRVTVLRRNGAALVPTGSVSGLGHDEQLYAVRFAGPLAYLVTFRQTDPLYVLDLRDEAHPKVSARLTLPGFSTYLHPLGAGRLVGVGQLAGANGTARGLQVSLFDVSDPARPARTAALTLPDRYPSYDPSAHAFLWWPATGTLAIPVDGLDAAAGRSGSGTLVLTAGARSLRQVGILPGTGAPMAPRSLVVGDTLWTLTGDRLAGSDLTTLAPRATIRV